MFTNSFDVRRVLIAHFICAVKEVFIIIIATVIKYSNDKVLSFFFFFFFFLGGGGGGAILRTVKTVFSVTSQSYPGRASAPIKWLSRWEQTQMWTSTGIGITWIRCWKIERSVKKMEPQYEKMLKKKIIAMYRKWAASWENAEKINRNVQKMSRSMRKCWKKLIATYRKWAAAWENAEKINRNVQKMSRSMRKCWKN